MDSDLDNPTTSTVAPSSPKTIPMTTSATTSNAITTTTTTTPTPAPMQDNRNDTSDVDGTPSKVLFKTDNRQKRASWSGGDFPVGGLFRGSAATATTTNSPMGKPPAVQRQNRQRSLDDARKDFHERNQQFLMHQSPKVPSPPKAASPSVAATGPVDQHGNPMPHPSTFSHPNKVAWASPNMMSRKRLESIDENKYVQVDPLKSPATPGSVVRTNLPSLAHFRSSSDDMSELSLLSMDSASSSVLHKQRLQRFEEYEDQQKKEFEETKEGIRSKLCNVLDRSIPPSEKEKNDFIREYMDELERERETLMAKWKAELEAEHIAMEHEASSPISAWGQSLYEAVLQPTFEGIVSALAWLECFIANLPLTVGAMGLSWVTMGSVWFKYMEEMTDFCAPTHFNSDRCTFPEFPGCFECDTTQDLYRIAYTFHTFCSYFAGMCCVAFMLKVVLAWRVVADELSNPTTSTPVGVVCVATICAFAGRGDIGEAVVLITSTIHLILSVRFLYMAIFQYRLWPDPGWFPNTVGLGYAAIKTWLYYPTPGLILLGITVVYFVTIFFVSTVRVAVNRKIAAPVAWITLSAPSITLYCMTLIAQPTRSKEMMMEDDEELRTSYHRWMSKYYMHASHTMMVLALLAFVAGVHSLLVRWEKFRLKPFGPAHIAFCFPVLSHTNAVQAYRGAVNAFSNFPDGGSFKTALYWYWFTLLVGGTLFNLVFSFKYIRRLLEWTKVEGAGEEEPPRPEETFVHEMLDGTDTHEFLLDQPFVNPAVLQANEAGALVRVRRGTANFRLHGPYMRTRRVQALGFDPTMSDDELRRERAELLDWVAKNAPRTRHRTMSNQSAILQSFSNAGVYGALGDSSRRGGRHKRSATSSGVPGV